MCPTAPSFLYIFNGNKIGWQQINVNFMKTKVVVLKRTNKKNIRLKEE